MNKAELEQRISTVCRMRRLSRHTERTYTDCVPRESGDVISPLDALTQTKIIPFAPPHPQPMEWSA